MSDMKSIYQAPTLHTRIYSGDGWKLSATVGLLVKAISSVVAGPLWWIRSVRVVYNRLRKAYAIVHRFPAIRKKVKMP